MTLVSLFLGIEFLAGVTTVSPLRIWFANTFVVAVWLPIRLIELVFLLVVYSWLFSPLFRFPLDFFLVEIEAYYVRLMVF
jgi:hypothetical protein